MVEKELKNMGVRDAVVDLSGVEPKILRLSLSVIFSSGILKKWKCYINVDSADDNDRVTVLFNPITIPQVCEQPCSQLTSIKFRAMYRGNIFWG